jgi:hypothetical protein
MSVSATGSELTVHVGRALDQDIDRRALSLEQRRGYKYKRRNK